MLYGNLTSQRFFHLPDVHDLDSAQGAVGKKPLPFLGHVGAQIRDDRIDPVEARVSERNPIHIVDVKERVDPPGRNNADP